MSNWPLRFDATPESNRSVVPDTPIDFSIPYKSREKGASGHFGFFPFFAKKQWTIVQEYIKYYTLPGDLVCDPFAGSGVTPVEALVLGRRAVAGDINPVARFITRMTAVAPIDLTRLNDAYDQVRTIAQKPIESLDVMPDSDVQMLLDSLDYPRDPIPSTVRRAGLETVDQLHTLRQLAGLTILRDAINQIEEPLYCDLMKVVLANTVPYANIMYILPFDKGKRRSPYRGDVGFLRRFSYSPASAHLFYENRIWPTVEHIFPAVYKAKEGSGSHENAGPFAVVAMEKEVQASFMHTQRCGRKRVFCVQNEPVVVVACYSSVLREQFLLFPSRPLYVARAANHRLIRTPKISVTVSHTSLLEG